MIDFFKNCWRKSPVWGRWLFIGLVSSLVLALLHDEWNVEILWGVNQFGWMLQLLTIVGLILALVQIRQGDTVSGSLSTRYLATFPAYMAELEGHLLKSEREITIICSTPIVGQASAPTIASTIRLVLERKMNAGIDVTLVFNGSERRRKSHEQQFTEETWEAWRGENLAMIGQFIERFLGDVQCDGCDKSVRDIYKERGELYLKGIGVECFRGWLNKANDNTLALLKNSSHRFHETQVDEDLHFHAWIVDRKEAMFAFPKTDEDRSGFCFYTRDVALVGGLFHLAEQLIASNVAKQSAPSTQRHSLRPEPGA
jgi:hypothetical protein